MPRSRPQRPSIRDVAALAGVSTATVSNAIAARNGSASTRKMSESTLKRVVAAADQLGYQPNSAARAVRTGRSNLVILSVSMLRDPWSQTVIDAVQEETDSRGMTSLVLADGNWPEVARKGIADVIFVDSTDRPGTLDELRELSAQGIRVMVFDEDLEPEGFDVVRSHSREGVSELVDYLARDGEPVSCLGRRSLEEAGPRSRERWWHEGIVRNGLDPECSRLFVFDGTPRGAYAAALEMYSSPSYPPVLFAISDYVAVEAMKAARTCGLEPGRDVRIAGAGNSPIEDETLPTLTTTGPDGFFATLAAFIADRAQGEKSASATSIDFTWTIHKRDSA